MDIAKYELVPTEFATAKEIGLAPATLGAMVRRGMVEATNTSPKRYRRIDNVAIKVYQLCEENKHKYDTYFTVFKKDKELGMLCSISNNNIVDCWGNVYDLTNACAVQFGKEKILIGG